MGKILLTEKVYLPEHMSQIAVMHHEEIPIWQRQHGQIRADVFHHRSKEEESLVVQ